MSDEHLRRPDEGGGPLPANAIRELLADDIPACEAVLRSVPEWFGIEEANRAYIASLRRLPGAVAEEVGGGVVGFIALEEHGPGSVEIHVLAVHRERHRRGIGTALVAWAEDRCRRRGVRWLHVKTRGPSTPDANYERTRRFYLARGFEPLFETSGLWGPTNAALILVKRLPTSS